MSKLFPIILIAIIAEIAVWIGVAQFISGWYVFFWFIIAFFIGLNMLRSSLATIMPQMQQMQMGGQMGAMGSPKIALAMSGFLLMLPGLISDVFALLILIPPIQKICRTFAMGILAKRQQAMMEKMMGGMMGGAGGMGGNDAFADLMRQMQQMQNQTGQQDSSIIDGEAHEVAPERKQIGMKDVTPKK
ncbi:FxsA family protein [Acinetobacter larvae]|uniref:FxsA protein n=1 Tax=Acinetobacter larvae TaxID=1789224 RepID=A0A1B2M0M2_9GAMM|nr:FxsA family protein [Acinetobacter larvae]AOA58725.1 FxsA protein [Acinetobacter larvae]